MSDSFPDYEAAAIHLWYQDGNRNRYEDALEASKDYYLDRAHQVVDAALGDEPRFRLVEDDPEYSRYRVLTENWHKPLPEGVIKWWVSGDGSPDGYFVQVWPEGDTG